MAPVHSDTATGRSPVLPDAPAIPRNSTLIRHLSIRTPPPSTPPIATGPGVPGVATPKPAGGAPRTEGARSGDDGTFVADGFAGAAAPVEPAAAWAAVEVGLALASWPPERSAASEASSAARS